MKDEKLKFHNEEELIQHYCKMAHPKALSPAAIIVMLLLRLLGQSLVWS